MTRHAYRHPGTAAAAALLLAFASGAAHAASYTYHGELWDGDAPADGLFDVRVRAFTAADGRNALGDATELPRVKVAKGRFAVQLELPERADGDTFVEVAIRRADTGEAYEVLGAPQAVSKVNQGCWALDGNAGLPAGSFLGIAEDVPTPLVLRARTTPVATFTPAGTVNDYGDAPRVAFGSSGNAATGIGATVGGGGYTIESNVDCPTCANVASGDFATVAGGARNTALGSYTTVSGGFRNVADKTFATAAGGSFNSAAGINASVLGGQENLAIGDSSAIGGGEQNVAYGGTSTIVGGQNNVASGSSAVVIGSGNCAGGNLSVAMGSLAVTRAGNEPTDLSCPSGSSSGDADGDEGSFVWGDSGVGFIESSGPNQFIVRARGGVGINAAPVNASVELTVTSDADGTDVASLWLRQRGVGADGSLLSANGNNLLLDHFDGTTPVRRATFATDGSVEIRSNVTGAATGVVMAANGGSWSSISDRRLKSAIVAVDPAAILDRLLSLPLATWSYTAQGPDVRHIGPMAQDFAAAFGVGENDTTISTVDADGVALAAIQGLNAKLERENASLREELDALRARLDRLEASQ